VASTFPYDGGKWDRRPTRTLTSPHELVAVLYWWPIGERDRTNYVPGEFAGEGELCGPVRFTRRRVRPLGFRAGMIADEMIERTVRRGSRRWPSSWPTFPAPHVLNEPCPSTGVVRLPGGDDANRAAVARSA